MAAQPDNGKRSRQWFELTVVACLALATAWLFHDGQLDIYLAGLFYNTEPQAPLWPQQHFWLWSLLYYIGYPSVVASALLAILVWLLSYWFKALQPVRLKAVYFFLIAVVGPGLIVNLGLKDHWGRPRPREIIEFNGTHSYQAPWAISASGKKSFVCGHCSAASMFFAFYFMLGKGKYLALILATVYTALMGVARMTAGGHFVSDIIWSTLLMFLLCWFFYYYLLAKFK